MNASRARWILMAWCSFMFLITAVLFLRSLRTPAKAQAATSNKATNPVARAAASNSIAHPLFDGKTLRGWQVSDFAASGEVEIKDATIQINMGELLTGISWTNALPVTNQFEVALEARKLDGSDFFCGLTFPVGTNHCTLIVGGWGGGLVGLSSIDNRDASENETTKILKIEKNHWYRIRVRVTDKKIEGWMDDQQVIEVAREGKQFSLRLGEIYKSTPLGLATFQTSAQFRNITMK